MHVILLPVSDFRFDFSFSLVSIWAFCCCTRCAVRVKSGQLRQPEALGISAELKSQVLFVIMSPRTRRQLPTATGANSPVPLTVRRPSTYLREKRGRQSTSNDNEGFNVPPSPSKRPKRMPSETSSAGPDAIASISSSPSSPQKHPFPHHRVPRKRNVSTSFPSAVTQMSPKLLFYAVQCLSYAQWTAIEEIGFGGVYWLRVNQIPMQLGYWLLSNYEPAKNCLILPGGKELHLRAADVHATLGFPMGSKEVQLAKSLNDSDDFSRFYNTWRDRFQPASGLVSTKTLVHHLVDQEDGGNLFKINWVVLVVSLLIQNTQTPNANFHVLKSLMSVDEIPQYNWCEFVLTSLRTCQKSWVNTNRKGYVTGPLLFLMLVYVDRVVHETRYVDRDYFTLVGWTTPHLNAREKAEKSYGTFGIGSIEDIMTEVIDTSSHNASEQQPSSSRSPQEIKDYVVDLAATTKEVSDQLILLQSKLDCGSAILPANQTIKKLRSVAQSLLNGTDELNENHSPNNIEVGASVDVSPKVLPCLNMDDDDAFFNLPDVISAIDRAEKVFESRKSSNKSPKIYESPEAYIHDFAVSAKNMACNMVSLDEKVEAGVTNYPDNETVKKLHNSTSLLYRNYGGVDEEAPASMWDTDEVSDASLIAACDAAKKAYERKRRYQAILEKYRNRSPGVIGEFTFDLGVGSSIKEGTSCVPEEGTCVAEEGTNDVVTPEDNPRDGGDAVQDDDNNSEDNDSEETNSDPMITVDYDGNDDKPSSSSFPTSNPLGGDRVMTRKRSSTTPLVPELRSPFIIRNIDVNVPIAKRKQMLCDYIFSTSAILTAPEKEIVFQYKLITVTRSVLRSLRPREHVSSSVLDSWAAYLNYRERSKSDSSILRFYGSTLIFRVTMKSSNQTEEQMNKSFKNALQAELNEFNWFQLKLIDMFFFPISMRNHFVVYVFDLKSNAFYILDNYFNRARIENIYGTSPTVMKEALAHFLMSHNETRYKGEAVDGLEPVVVKMAWRNTTNIDDCGVYAMRHMETFKGDSKWVCGLEKNDSHRQSGADISISCLPMDDSRASDFGLMKIDDTGRVLFFNEKPKGDDFKAMAVDTTVLGLSKAEAEKKPYIASMGCVHKEL
ncbi:hypothetical protein RND81_07G071300 [Saponaria officinalis]|uniref:Ubiquitin-like protease family profile domain-containing protein n=1 Tax=Saponaria officinalis TaxID=3572 RepID=A0AAW1JND2_SAPOF